MIIGYIITFIIAALFAFIFFAEDEKLTIQVLMLLFGATMNIILIILSFILNNQEPLMIVWFVSFVFIMIGGFLGDLQRFLGKWKLRKNGIKTYGILKSITATGWYSSEHNCRELILEFDYKKKDGTAATGEVRSSVDNYIEPRLNIGMILPVMYSDENPTVLAFERDLDYEIIEEGNTLANRI